MAKDHYHQIEKIEAKENIGSYGAWRREFCGKYRELLIQVRNNSYNALLKTLALKRREHNLSEGMYLLLFPLCGGAISSWYCDR